jgi:CBS domain containing-hemolysin-like protein
VDSLLAIAIITVLIVLNGLFVAAEFAIVGAPRAAIDHRAAQGQRVARAVGAILHDPRRQDRFIATAQLGITLASLGLGMYGEHVLAEWLAAGLTSLGEWRWLASHGLASALSVAILTYFHIVIGEMIPKSLALQAAERTVLWISTPMIWIGVAFSPLVIVLNGVGNGLLRLLGVDRRTQSTDRYYTPEELQLLVEESEAGGVLRAEAGRMLLELFEFGDLTAGQVMVPRVRVSGIPVDASPGEVRSIVRRSHHTRYPVYQGDLDHVGGMVHIKDVLRGLLANESVWAQRLRPLPVVPDTAPLDKVLSTMRRERTQMLIVIDEHGGTAGIVTLDDLFEEVVGPIDEGPTDAPAFQIDADGRLRVRGTVRLDELGQRFDLELEHEEVDSVSGLVLALLGRPPRVGDTVQYGRVRIDVTAVKGHGVEQAAVTLLADTRNEG